MSVVHVALFVENCTCRSTTLRATGETEADGAKGVEAQLREMTDDLQAAMQNLIDYADQRGLRIELTPAQKGDPNGTTSRGRLVKFYKGLGFVENKGRAKDFSTTAGMVREPKALQQSNPAAAPSKPSPETIELRKREKVLQRLLECLA